MVLQATEAARRRLSELFEAVPIRFCPAVRAGRADRVARRRRGARRSGGRGRARRAGSARPALDQEVLTVSAWYDLTAREAASARNACARYS